MATPTVLSFTVRDDDGVKASAPFYTQYDGALETVDAMIGTWLALGADVDAVTGGVIEGGSILIPLSPDASWKDTPITGQSVSDTLNVNFNNASTRFLWSMVIPALRDTLVSGGRPIVASGAIKTLTDLMLAGFTNGSYINPSGDDLQAVVDAFQGVRKHRKQLTARSKVIV
jgi:hypothetical protein